MRIVSIILCLVIILSGCSSLHEMTQRTEVEYVNSYKPIEENFVLDINEPYHIYDPDELTTEILEHRTEHNELIIERLIGRSARNGDGVILNTSDSHNYISYKHTGLPYIDGTILLTYCIYNPDSNDTDDIIERFDFILDREHED